MMRLEYPRVYNRVIHNIDLFFFSIIGIIHTIIVLQDFGILSTTVLTLSVTPMILLLAILVFAILVVRESLNYKDFIAMDSRDPKIFEEET